MKIDKSITLEMIKTVIEANELVIKACLESQQDPSDFNETEWNQMILEYTSGSNDDLAICEDCQEIFANEDLLVEHCADHEIKYKVFRTSNDKSWCEVTANTPEEAIQIAQNNDCWHESNWDSQYTWDVEEQ